MKTLANIGGVETLYADFTYLGGMSDAVEPDKVVYLLHNLGSREYAAKSDYATLSNDTVYFDSDDDAQDYLCVMPYWDIADEEDLTVEAWAHNDVLWS